MGSIQNLVKWLKDRTSRKKKTVTHSNPEKSSEKDLPSSTRSSLYGFHRKEHVCENSLYSKSSGETRTSAGTRTSGGTRTSSEHGPVTRASPFRLYNDSPAHVYEEIPGSMVATDLNENGARDRIGYNINNLDFSEAKEVGPYLVVPIRKQSMGGNNKFGLIRTKDLVDVVQSTEILPTSETVLDTTSSQLCSNRDQGSKLDFRSRDDRTIHTVSDLHNFPQSQNTRQVVAEIHRSVDDSALDYSSSPEEYIHCKKCKRPHGIYKENFMEHYESDDNVFDEPDLIKDSQVKGQGQTEVVGKDNVDMDIEGVMDSDESVYGIREQIYSTTEELLNDEYTCNRCATKALSSYQHNTFSDCDKDENYSKKDDPKMKSKVPHWKRYVSMGSVRKVLFNHKEEEPKSSEAIDIPGGISYSTVSTRLSPNTLLLLDGRHYKTLPIDLVTPVTPSGVKKPFGYDKLELSTSKTGPKPQYNVTSEHQKNSKESKALSLVSQTELPVGSGISVSRWQPNVRNPRNVKPRSSSCSDIIDDNGHQDAKQRSRIVSVSDECEYMSMAHGSSPRHDSSFVSATSEHSPSGLAMEKKKAKILKSISKARSKDNIITIGPPGGGQKMRSISMTDNDIYNCDAETKRKIHLLTRNKLSSTWNGPRLPPKSIQHVLARHSTLPHSFSPSPKRGFLPFNGSSSLQQSQFTRSSDSLLLPKQLSSKDFHTLNKNTGFPGPLYLRQGGLHGKLKEQMLSKRRFASSSDCLLTSTIAEESPSVHSSAEKLSCRATHFSRRRSLSYDANAQTYTNAAAITQNQACSYQRKHNPLLSDLMRVNNDRQTLMLV